MEYKCNVLYSFPYNFVPFSVISLLCASFKSYQCRMMNLKEKRVLCFSVNFIITHRQKAQKRIFYQNVSFFHSPNRGMLTSNPFFVESSCSSRNNDRYRGDQRNMFSIKSNISHKHQPTDNDSLWGCVASDLFSTRFETNLSMVERNEIIKLVWLLEYSFALPPELSSGRRSCLFLPTTDCLPNGTLRNSEMA